MKNTALYILLLLTGAVSAQNEMSLFNLRHLPQVVNSNPAFLPLGRINVSIPYLGSQYTQIGKSEFDTDVSTVDSNGQFSLDVSKFINGIEDRNTIYSTFNVEALHVGFALDKNYFFISTSDKIVNSFTFPKEMVLLITEVFDEQGFQNETKMEDILMDYNHYRYFGVGMSRQVNDKLTIGAQFKLLGGLAVIRSNTATLLINGRDSNELTGLATVDIQTSGVEDYNYYISNINTFEEFINSPFFGFTGTRNYGFSMDLGVNYQINPTMRIGLSVLDLAGSIKWKDGNKIYQAKDVALNFETINWEDLTDPSGGGFVEFLDSIFRHTDSIKSQAPFVTSIPTRLNAAYSYSITPKIDATLLSQFVFGEKEVVPRLRVGIQGRFKRFINYMVSYTLLDDHMTSANLGLGLVLNFGPFQIHAITDNILDPYMFRGAFTPTLRFGANLTFGRDYE